MSKELAGSVSLNRWARHTTAKHWRHATNTGALMGAQCHACLQGRDAASETLNTSLPWFCSTASTSSWINLTTRWQEGILHASTCCRYPQICSFGGANPTTLSPLSRCQLSRESWKDIYTVNRFLAYVTEIYIYTCSGPCSGSAT